MSAARAAGLALLLMAPALAARAEATLGPSLDEPTPEQIEAVAAFVARAAGGQ